MPVKTKRRKKLIRVLKRKWLKPALYTIGMSIFLYICISSIVIQKKVIERHRPHFLITRISDKFDEIEFMHLLLTIQEINYIPKASTQLVEFANGPFPGICPDFLTQQLNQMNWQPQAFLIRLKKIYSMHNQYNRLQRLEATIAFLKEEYTHHRLPKETRNQIDLLIEERDNLKNTEFTPESYRFIEKYAGLIQTLKNK